MDDGPSTDARKGRPARTRTKVRPIRGPAVAPVHPFDRRHGTDTGGLIPGSALSTGHPSDPHTTAYYAVAPSILHALIERWLESGPLLPIDRYTFLDVGAGKGRALLGAALHPFHAVVGIELNPGLAAIARANITRVEGDLRHGLLAPIAVREGDALAVPLPSGPTVIFLFHPFEATLLQRFLARVVQHFAVGRDPLDLLYVNAEHAAVLDRNPAFQQVFEGLLSMSAEDHLADLAEIAEQSEYGSTGDEICTIDRLTRQFGHA